MHCARGYSKTSYVDIIKGFKKQLLSNAFLASKGCFWPLATFMRLEVKNNSVHVTIKPGNQGVMTSVWVEGRVPRTETPT